jgi:lysophospholipase L1-like esterase
VPIVAWVLAYAAVLACLPCGASARAEAYVLGDSIGEGVAIASGLKKLAHISVHIRGSKAIQQIDATPVGAVAFIVLGTNDAEGSLNNIEKSIDDVLRAGKRRNLTMIWLGPPCVRRPFDGKARELDGILNDRLRAASVKYVSMRDEQLCSGVFHEPDGVHLTMKGYRYMWAKAKQAVSWPYLAESNNSEPIVVASGQRVTTATPSSATVAVPQDPPAPFSPHVSDKIGPMVVEIHRPPHGVSFPIVWTGVSN